jgi:hypothetical protein
MEFFVQEIVGRNIESQYFYSDDDVSGISGSDSNTLENVEKAEFLDKDCSMLAGSDGNLDT